MIASLLPAVLGMLAAWVLVPDPPLARLGRRPTFYAALRELGRRRSRQGATAALASELPEALEFLAACLESGLSMRSAVQTVSDVSLPETKAVLDEISGQLALGRAGPLAWEALRQHPCWGRAAADIARSERSGTALVGLLRLHADDARREARDLATKRARTVGVRSVVPLMVCFLPAFVLVGVVPIIAGLLKGFLG